LAVRGGFQLPRTEFCFIITASFGKSWIVLLVKIFLEQECIKWSSYWFEIDTHWSWKHSKSKYLGMLLSDLSIFNE
jgi:hypothetical protein